MLKGESALLLDLQTPSIVSVAPTPKQTFFARDMGLPLTMTPNYDDFSCQ